MVILKFCFFMGGRRYVYICFHFLRSAILNGLEFRPSAELAHFMVRDILGQIWQDSMAKQGKNNINNNTSKAGFTSQYYDAAVPLLLPRGSYISHSDN